CRAGSAAGNDATIPLSFPIVTPFGRSVEFSTVGWISLTGGELFGIPMRGHPYVCTVTMSRTYHSIWQAPLIWAVQGKSRNLNIKTLTANSLHQVSAPHHARRCIERRTTDVFKALSRPESWLLPNYSRSFDFSQFASRIGDHPVPTEKLHRFRSLILDYHAVGPKIL